MKKIKQRGLKLSKNVAIVGKIFIVPSHCWHFEIRKDLIIAPCVHIPAHGASIKLFS